MKKRYFLLFVIVALALLPLYSNAVTYDADGTPIYTEKDLNSGGSMEVTGGDTMNEETPVTDTVYITDTGKKYHRKGCKYLWGSGTPISRKQAEERGYTPCSECKP